MNDSESQNIREELGEKLKAARIKANLTQSEVAEKSDVHVNYYARIERGEENPTYEKLYLIMRVLKMKALRID